MHVGVVTRLRQRCLELGHRLLVLVALDQIEAIDRLYHRVVGREAQRAVEPALHRIISTRGGLRFTFKE